MSDGALYDHLLRIRVVEGSHMARQNAIVALVVLAVIIVLLPCLA